MKSGTVDEGVFNSWSTLFYGTIYFWVHGIQFYLEELKIKKDCYVLRTMLGVPLL